MLEIYCLNGQTVFPVYSATGGLTYGHRTYLIDRERKLAYGYDPQDTTEEQAAKDFDSKASNDFFERYTR